MEILIGVVFVIGFVVLIVVAGKAKGPPEPSSMSKAGIRQRIEAENEWMFKFH